MTTIAPIIHIRYPSFFTRHAIISQMKAMLRPLRTGHYRLFLSYLSLLEYEVNESGNVQRRRCIQNP